MQLAADPITSLYLNIEVETFNVQFLVTYIAAPVILIEDF